MKNNNQVNQSSFHLNCVNGKRIEESVAQNQNLKLYKDNKIKKVLISTIVAAIIGGGIGYQLKTAIDKNNYQPPLLPDDCVAMDIDVKVEYGDTVTEIASRYYNDDYEQMYGEFEHYVDAVLDKNDLDSASKILPGDDLTVPVIFDKDNPFYMESAYLQHQITEIKDNEYWVPHTVTYLDGSISELAAKASGTDSEVGIISSQIMAHNDLENSMIKPGQQLDIVNPELGPLKIALNEAKENLNTSIQNNNKQKM